MCRASGSYLCEKSRRDGVFCSNGFQSVGI